MTAEDVKNLRKKYLVLIKKISTEDLRYVLSVLYCNPEWILDNHNFKKVKPKEKTKYRDLWLKLHMFNILKYDKIKEDLKTDFGIYIDENNKRIPMPEISLLIDTIKPILDLRDEGKDISDEQTIKSIQFFTSENSKNDYKIIFNGDYNSNPLNVSKSKKIWDMMFELIQNGYLRSDNETKKLYDYLNFNENNLIAKNTKYPIQKLINQIDNLYKPNFKGSIYSEKALIQRQNKSKVKLKNT